MSHKQTAFDEELHSDRKPARQKKIWIDLDNSPHVPFFLPIIEELRRRHYKVVLTARNSYQVRALLEFHHVSCRVIGGHWGKHRAMKIFGTCLRATHLFLVMLREKPDLAVSHVSRAQFIVSLMLRIPTITIYDYEFGAGVGNLRPDWLFSPSYIPHDGTEEVRRREMKYPGLKEDVYVPRFRPDPSLKDQLGLSPTDLVVAARPPASEAHYHNQDSDVLFDAALDLFNEHPEIRVVLLPRNSRQEECLRRQWKPWLDQGKIIIPSGVVDGLNLIWCSDFVVSGGGTMNREAAALGVPVYSVFRGPIGAVDQYLAANGRLTLLESIQDVRSKITFRRRCRGTTMPAGRNETLARIVDGIVSVIEHGRLP